MVKRNTSITINGKRYDALTGNLLANPIVPRKSPKKSIDGMTSSAVPQKHVVSTTPSKPAQPERKPHAAAAHATAHHAKPSSTLMRHAVSKPKPSVKRRVKVQATVHSPSTVTHSTAVVMPKVSIGSVNSDRAARAATVNTSPLISRYAHDVAAAETVVVSHVEAAAHAVDKAIVIPQTGHYHPDIAPVRRAANNGTSDIFEQALLRATSHEQDAPEIPTTKQGRKRYARLLRRRMVTYGAGAMVVLALVGFLNFKSADSVKFRTAARSAGFSATMPGYEPKGFDVASVKASNGTVYMNYARTNNASNVSSQFAITQRATNWDNQTLLSNILAGSSTYNAVQKSGRTVYLYGTNQAAWVSKGILYQVLGNGALNTEDFVAIATSM